MTTLTAKPRFAIRRYASLEEMKADEYQYWQQQPAYVRMDAVEEITRESYSLKDSLSNVSRLQRTVSHLKR
jgi:hypothetical protein